MYILCWVLNNDRLSNNKYLNLVNISEQEILAVFALPAPYEIKDGVRYYAGTYLKRIK